MYPDISRGHLRKISHAIMTHVADDVTGVTLVILRGDCASGCDGRQNFKYLVPQMYPPEEIARLHLLASDRAHTISNLERKLALMRWGVSSQGTSAASCDGTDTTSLSPREREQAVRKAGRIVREDVVSSPGLKNVTQGKTHAENIERDLVPPREYMAVLPATLRILFREVFGYDMGLDRARESAQGQPPQGRGDNRHKMGQTFSYFLATMVVKVVLRRSTGLSTSSCSLRW